MKKLGLNLARKKKNRKHIFDRDSREGFLLGAAIIGMAAFVFIVFGMPAYFFGSPGDTYNDSDFAIVLGFVFFCLGSVLLITILTLMADLSKWPGWILLLLPFLLVTFEFPESSFLFRNEAPLIMIIWGLWAIYLIYRYLLLSKRIHKSEEDNLEQEKYD